MPTRASISSDKCPAPLPRKRRDQFYSSATTNSYGQHLGDELVFPSVSKPPSDSGSRPNSRTTSPRPSVRASIEEYTSPMVDQRAGSGLSLSDFDDSNTVTPFASADIAVSQSRKSSLSAKLSQKLQSALQSIPLGIVTAQLHVII